MEEVEDQVVRIKGKKRLDGYRVGGVHIWENEGYIVIRTTLFSINLKCNGLKRLAGALL